MLEVAEMSGKILVFMENSIGPQLLLTGRLQALGYAVTVVSTPDGARKRIRAEFFDWLILDETATQAEAGSLLEEVARRQKPCRIVWLGFPPRRAGVRIEAVFDKPLDYGKIARFFSAKGSEEPGRAGSRSGGTCREAGPEDFRSAARRKGFVESAQCVKAGERAAREAAPVVQSLLRGSGE